MVYEATVSVFEGKKFVLVGERGYDIAKGKVVITEVIVPTAVDKAHVMEWMETHTQDIDSLSYTDRLDILEEVRKMCQEPWVTFRYDQVWFNGGYVPANEAEYSMDPMSPIPLFVFMQHVLGE
ncbi:hypothetical protein D1872_51360 [compost metagenome]